MLQDSIVGTAGLPPAEPSGQWLGTTVTELRSDRPEKGWWKLAYAPLRPYFFWREPRTAFREIFDECERHYEREGKYWLICFAPDAVLAARNIRTIFEHWHRKHSPDRCDAPIEKFLSHDFALGTFGAACAFKQWLEPAIYDEVDRELLLIWPGQPIIWLDEEDRYDGTSPLMEAREFLSCTLRQPLEQMGLIPRRLPRGEDPTELMIEPLMTLLHDATFVEDYCEDCPVPRDESIERFCALIDRLQDLYELSTQREIPKHSRVAIYSPALSEFDDHDVIRVKAALATCGDNAKAETVYQVARPMRRQKFLAIRRILQREHDGNKGT